MIKQRVKEGITEKYIALVEDFSVESMKGCRSREIVEVDEHNFIIIVDYEDISSVIDAREPLVSNLGRIRHLLVEIDDDGNVTDPASGTLIFRDQSTDA